MGLVRLKRTLLANSVDLSTLAIPPISTLFSWGSGAELEALQSTKDDEHAEDANGIYRLKYQSSHSAFNVIGYSKLVQLW